MDTDAVMSGLASIASAICTTSCSLWLNAAGEIAAAWGLPSGAMPYAALCALAGPAPGLLVIEDTADAAALHEHALVRRPSRIRFIAGLGLGPSGTLYMLGPTPRALDEAQRRALRALAAGATACLRHRKRRIELGQALRRARVEYEVLRRHSSYDETLLNSSPNLICVKTGDLRYVLYNNAFASHFGISKTEWLGRRDEDVRPPAIAARRRAEDEAALRSPEPIVLTRRVVNAAGETKILKLVRFARADSAGQKILAIVAVDVTKESEQEAELAGANERLEKLAATDGLTGVPNRRSFDETLQRTWAQAIRERGAVGLIMLDIDHFKAFNDFYGHHDGDDCLRIVAMRASRDVREGDLFARFGGEEFAVILPGAALAAVARIAERIRAGIEAKQLPHQGLGEGYIVTVSVGAASMIPGPGDDVRQLVEAADANLYTAKRRGRNQVCAAETQTEASFCPQAEEGGI